MNEPNTDERGWHWDMSSGDLVNWVEYYKDKYEEAKKEPKEVMLEDHFRGADRVTFTHDKQNGLYHARLFANDVLQEHVVSHSEVRVLRHVNAWLGWKKDDNTKLSA